MAQKKQFCVLLTALMMFGVGCSSDTIGPGNQECVGEDCGKEQQCTGASCNTQCEGESCTTTNPEQNDLCQEDESFCMDAQTLQKCVKGQKPAYEVCAKGCDEDACLTEGEDILCEVTDSHCMDEQYLSVCVTGSTAEIVDCSTRKNHGVCKNDECLETTPVVGVGEHCDTTTECVSNAYCEYGGRDICVAYAQHGQRCDETSCGSGLICQSGVCHKLLNIGDKCEEYSVCNLGRCEADICQSISAEYEECGNNQICPENTVCIEKQCIPTKGECKSNSDCKGDTYCCLDASCGDNTKVCVPYSEHGHDDACGFKTKAGVFEASVQCMWKPTVASGNKAVMNTIVVGKIHNSKNIEKPLLAFISAGGSYYKEEYLRIIHPETCETIESIRLTDRQLRKGTYSNGQQYTWSGGGYSSVSLADFDGDGYMELVLLNGSNVSIYSWNGTAHTVAKSISNLGIDDRNGTLSIHDLDNDGVPEIIGTNGVVVHADGTILSSSVVATCSYTSPILGDLDRDGKVELIAGNAVYRWANQSNGWSRIASLSGITTESQFAYADFGTPGSNADSFDYDHFDGKAEIVAASTNKINIFAVFDSNGSVLSTPQLIMSQAFPNSQSWGYPPAIADMNGDGKPEIGVASTAKFGVYDPKCKAAVAGKCSAKNVIWESNSKDQSGIAGAVAFDFDGDGKIEIVYGDECYTRVYDGVTGEVLFSSYRNSGTVIEYPVIADVDDDGSTEIVISSDTSSACTQSQYNLDASHRGVKCVENADCYSNSCVGGLCRCTSDAQCNWQTIDGAVFNQYSCTTPLTGDATGGNVCRAKKMSQIPGVIVLRDRLDRWVSSRTIWNQHAYNITNINDDGSIPKTSEWKQNFTDSNLNNYRQQRQGKTGADVAPDITGRFTSAADICRTNGTNVLLNAQVCNRGTKDVGSKMPAVFYRNTIDPDNILCVSYTDDTLPMAVCRNVSCEITKEEAKKLQSQKIILLVNDDGKGGKTTVECDESNNTDEIEMTSSCVDN